MHGATMKIAPTCFGATTPEQCDIHINKDTTNICSHITTDCNHTLMNHN